MNELYRLCNTYHILLHNLKYGAIGRFEVCGDKFWKSVQTIDWTAWFWQDAVTRWRKRFDFVAINDNDNNFYMFSFYQSLINGILRKVLKQLQCSFGVMLVCLHWCMACPLEPSPCCKVMMCELGIFYTKLQFGSDDFNRWCKDKQLVPSISRRGNC